MKQILHKPYFFLFSSLVFFTPLLIATNTNELFEFPKMFFVYIFGLFIIWIFITDVVLHKSKIKLPPLLITLFVLATIVSTIFSSHIYTSVFGYYTRFNDGLLSYLVFFGLYIVAINKLGREDVEGITKISLLTIIPISIYGLSQYFGGPKILWNGGNIERVFSTFGQPNWLAQYLSVLLMICLHFLFTSKENFKKYFLVYVLGFYCFWVTFSVSGVLGLISGSIILFCVLFRKKSRETLPEDTPVRIILVLAISLFIVFSNIGIFGKKLNDAIIDFKKQIGVVDNAYLIASTSIPTSIPNAISNGDEYKVSDPGFIRTELWKSTINLIKSSPKVFFLGSGPETFPYSFQPFRSEKLNYSSEWDFVFNKPHNFYLEIFAESGVFTFIIYLYLIYKVFKKSLSCVLPAFGSFVVTNFFGWPNVSTSLLFWIFLSTVSFKDEFSYFEFNKKAKVGKKITLGFLWAMYICAVFLLLRFYSADVFFRKSQDLLKNDKVEKALFYVNKSIDINPYEPSYVRGRAKVNTLFLIDGEKVDLIKELVLSDLQKAYILNPKNLVVIRNSIPLYYFLAIEDINMLPGKDNVDEKYLDIVKDFFSRTKKDYWNDVGVISLVAKYERKLGFEIEYNESVKRVEYLRPDLLNWYESFR